MNPTIFGINIDKLVGTEVTYVGDNRDWLRGLPGIVKAVNKNTGGYTLGVLVGNELVYGADWAWELLPKTKIEPGKSFDIDELFTDAAGGKLAVAENEIARLKARIVELEKFVEVYRSL